ncbi:MAG: twin-arginine translocase subunit TatC [Planctomycetes bacterium]|nr:twin-arginine translocase subunit TatC [Planctomycetota bacterium]
MVDVVQEKRLTLGEHLRELRARLICFSIFFLAFFITSFFFQEQIFQIIWWPHHEAMSALKLPADLFALEYPETMLVFLKVNFIVALVFSSPFGLWQAWRFIGAGLYPRERKYVLPYLLLSLVLFITGVLFGYFYLIPTAFQFLAGYGGSEHIKMMITLGDYLSLFVILTLAFGVSFELPVVMLFFSAIGLASTSFYIRKLRLAIVLIFIFAAVITPTSDPFTMTFLALPLVGLYGLGIFLSFLIKRKNKV